jgi:hypothetical protein
VDEQDFYKDEGVMHAEEEVDPRAEDREDFDDIPEGIDESMEYEPEEEADVVENSR